MLLPLLPGVLSYMLRALDWSKAPGSNAMRTNVVVAMGEEAETVRVGSREQRLLLQLQTQVQGQIHSHFPPPL